MERYKLVDGSQSVHCCFTGTVVDVTKPVMIAPGKPYAPDGVQRYEAVCECFDEEDAKRIVKALNLMEG